MTPMPAYRMEIKYSKRFRSQYHKADKQIRAAFSQMLDLFLSNPNNPFLRNHALRDTFAGYRSIDVTEEWRAIFREDKTGGRTHDELYG
jgi:mRNA-degrading endonuclease YafQ of YafQ-DinJ toxin-antitoxin module